MAARALTKPALTLVSAQTLSKVRAEAAHCKACPLWQHATQTVFGEGPKRAAIMLVGEQPGHEEDLEGHPFVGPAGRLLDEALKAAGIERETVYVTNVVKHFKWTPKGKRRLHQKPNAREVGACIPWLDREIDLVKPTVLVCLGATAAQALFGRTFRVSVQRGKPVPFARVPHAMATIHPSAVLRMRTSEDRKAALGELVSDLRSAARLSARAQRKASA